MGDFFKFGLPDEFVSNWDRWVQQGMKAAEEQLGEGWPQAYYACPIWRFLLPPGFVGTRAAIGVLMPSVDRVGRRFPLTLAYLLPDGTPHLAAFLGGDGFLTRLEDLALQTLDGDVTPAGLEKALSNAGTPPIEVCIRVERDGHEVFQRSGDGSVVGDLAVSFMANTAQTKSIWCMSTELGSQAFAASGLPSHGAFVRLVDPFVEHEAIR